MLPTESLGGPRSATKVRSLAWTTVSDGRDSFRFRRPQALNRRISGLMRPLGSALREDDHGLSLELNICRTTSRSTLPVALRGSSRTRWIAAGHL